jgi:hypothetical protein
LNVAPACPFCAGTARDKRSAPESNAPADAVKTGALLRTRSSDARKTHRRASRVARRHEDERCHIYAKLLQRPTSSRESRHGLRDPAKSKDLLRERGGGIEQPKLPAGDHAAPRSCASSRTRAAAQFAARLSRKRKRIWRNSTKWDLLRVFTKKSRQQSDTRRNRGKEQEIASKR